MDPVERERLIYAVWDTYYRIQEDLRLPGARWRKNFQQNPNYPVFRQIVDLCLAEGLDPVAYVESFMTIIDKQYGSVTPRDMLSRAHMSTFRKIYETYGPDLEATWSSQKATLRAILTTRVPPVYANENEVLANFGVPFGSSFRVLGGHAVYDDIFVGYGYEVWCEVKRNARLRAFLIRREPANLKELARRHNETLEGLT